MMMMGAYYCQKRENHLVSFWRQYVVIDVSITLLPSPFASMKEI